MPRQVRAQLVQAGWGADLGITREDGPLPEPARDQVLVAVEACGVCHRDCIDREGRFPFLRLPRTPGHEAVGRVVAVGPKVDEWRVGDRVASMHRDFCGRCVACVTGEISLCQHAASVLGLTIDGGYQSHLLAPQRCFYAVGDALPAPEAAILHCTWGTAWRGLVRHGGLQAGQHALITGANGGVGHAAVQIAHARGAEVTAIVRDAAHQAFVESLGADRVLVDDGSGFHKRLGGKRADIALDCVGEPTFNASVRSLRVGGRLIAVGNVVPERVALNVGYIITFGLSIVGSSGATRDDMAALLDWWPQSGLDTRVHRLMGMGQADEAQRMVKAGGLHGRIVLVPDAP